MDIKKFDMFKVLAIAGVVLTMAAAAPLTSVAAGVSSPTITGISPSAGPVGTTITLTGTGFVQSPTVNFGGGVITSTKGGNTQVSFTLPSVIPAACMLYKKHPCVGLYMSVQPGTYEVSVTNMSGTSNSITFTVTQ